VIAVTIEPKAHIGPNFGPGAATPVKIAADSLPVGQLLKRQPQRARPVAGPARPGRDVVPGGEGVGVVRAEDPLVVGQQLQGQPPLERKCTRSPVVDLRLNVDIIMSVADANSRPGLQRGA
jgi:hypothetical protein